MATGSRSARMTPADGGAFLASAVPWLGVDVWFAFCVQLLLPSFVLGALEWAGLFRVVYGQALSVSGPRASLWAIVVALPFQVLAILSELESLRQVRPYQVGLTT